MDLNKASKVVEIGLRVARCCQSCRSWQEPLTGDAGSLFRECSKFHYDHKKHQRTFQISTIGVFVCDHWEASETLTHSDFLNQARLVAGENMVDTSKVGESGWWDAVTLQARQILERRGTPSDSLCVCGHLCVPGVEYRDDVVHIKCWTQGTKLEIVKMDNLNPVIMTTEGYGYLRSHGEYRMLVAHLNSLV